MSLGLGNIVVNSKKEPGINASSAYNGVSIDSTNKIVLGNDFGLLDAELLSNRLIPMGGQSITLQDKFSDVFTLFSGNAIELHNGVLNDAIYLTIVPGSETKLQLSFDPASVGRLRFDNGNSSEQIELLAQGGGMYFQVAPDDPGAATVGYFDANVVLWGNTTVPNGTLLRILSPSQVLESTGQGSIGNMTGLRLDYGNRLFAIGDVEGLSGNSVIIVNDVTGDIELVAGINEIALSAGSISINGTPGFTGTVAPVTSITVENGIVTAVS